MTHLKTTLPWPRQLKGWGFSFTLRSLFTLAKDPIPIVQEAGWAPGPFWTGAEILANTGIRSPDLPALSQSLYRLRYPAHRLLRISGNFDISACEYLQVLSFIWRWCKLCCKNTNQNEKRRTTRGPKYFGYTTNRKSRTKIIGLRKEMEFIVSKLYVEADWRSWW